MIHAVKCEPEYYEAVRSGQKLYELRYDDRNYCKGDYLALNEWDDRAKAYTGESILLYITNVFKDPRWLQKDVAVLSLNHCLVTRERAEQIYTEAFELE